MTKRSMWCNAALLAFAAGTASAAPTKLLQWLPLPSGTTDGNIRAVSADGTVVAGRVRGSSYGSLSFVWTETNGMQYLPEEFVLFDAIGSHFTDHAIAVGIDSGTHASSLTVNLTNGASSQVATTTGGVCGTGFCNTYHSSPTCSVFYGVSDPQPGWVADPFNPWQYELTYAGNAQKQLPLSPPSGAENDFIGVWIDYSVGHTLILQGGPAPVRFAVPWVDDACDLEPSSLYGVLPWVWGHSSSLLKVSHGGRTALGKSFFNTEVSPLLEGQIPDIENSSSEGRPAPMRLRGGDDLPPYTLSMGSENLLYIPVGINDTDRFFIHRPDRPNQGGDTFWLRRLPDGGALAGRHVSGNGDYAVGSAVDDNGHIRAVRWGGSEWPGELDPTGLFDEHAALAANYAGDVIVGTLGPTEEFPYEDLVLGSILQRAMIWTPAGGMRLLTDDITNSGFEIDEEDILFSAAGISDNGAVIAGVGEHNGQIGLWVLVPDCDENGVNDLVDIANDTHEDCNGNLIPDACEIASNITPDCNGNSIPDSCDIATGFSQDCDGNGVPDECDPDCNYNGIVDACECATELVFIVDTSQSMDNTLTALCEALPDVFDSLANSSIRVRATIYYIGGSPSVATCFSSLSVLDSFDSVAAHLGLSVPCAAPADLLGDCQPLGLIEEDWARAAAIVADRHAWHDGYARRIFVVTDEGPWCGDTCNSGTSTTEQSLIDCARDTALFVDPGDPNDRVSEVYGLIPIRMNTCPRSWALELSTATTGRTDGILDIDDSQPGYVLAEGIYDFILNTIHQSCPQDCNLNGVIDLCEQARPECAPCLADYNNNGVTDADDIYAYLDIWFIQNGFVGIFSADFNHDGVVNADDIFAYMDAWFAENGICGMKSN